MIEIISVKRAADIHFNKNLSNNKCLNEMYIQKTLYLPHIEISNNQLKKKNVIDTSVMVNLENIKIKNVKNTIH